jgi:hypothetical protein
VTKAPLEPNWVLTIHICTGCPITHGIHCKKSVKMKCQFKKTAWRKKMWNAMSINFILSIFVGGRWSELGAVKNWAKSLHKWNHPNFGSLGFLKSLLQKSPRTLTWRLKSIIFSSKWDTSQLSMLSLSVLKSLLQKSPLPSFLCCRKVAAPTRFYNPMC